MLKFDIQNMIFDGLIRLIMTEIEKFSSNLLSRWEYVWMFEYEGSLLSVHKLEIYFPIRAAASSDC